MTVDPIRAALAAPIDLLRALGTEGALASVRPRGVALRAALAAVGAAITPVGL